MKTGSIRLFKHFLPGTYVLLLGFELSLFTASYLIGAGLDLPHHAWQATHLKQAFGMAGLMTAAMVAMGLYNSRIHCRLPDVATRLIASFVLMGLAVIAVGLLLPVQMPSPAAFVIGSLFGFVSAMMLRALVGKYIVDLDMWNRRVLVLGAGDSAHQVEAMHHSPLAFRDFVSVGYVRLAGDNRVEHEVDSRVFPEGTPLAQLVRQHGVDEIVVAGDHPCASECVAELLPVKMAGVPVYELIDFIEREGGKIDLRSLSPDWMVFAEGFTQGSLRRVSKRVVDLGASLALLAITWPVLLLAMLAIRLDDGGPVFFRQIRVGAYGREFGLLKLRSMRVDAEKHTGAVWASKNDDRTTRIGHWLRKLRIDELPQLLNVLRGEMSFVGPRPERPEFVGKLAEKIPHYDLRHIVKPGITGWAQINYPYGATDEDAYNKHQFDLYYVKNHSLFLDLMIILQTVEVILWGRGQ